MTLLDRIIDLRKSPRRPCRAEATIDADGRRIEGRMIDVSAGGCRVAVGGWPFPPASQPLQRCDITIGDLTLGARVVWIAGDRSAVGFQFKSTLNQAVLARLAESQ